MPQEEHWSRQNDESPIWKRSYLAEAKSLLAGKEARRTLVFYLVGMVLMILGGVYALWRIAMLDRFMAENRAYVIARDERWERHIQGQAELSREILRRLPK